MKQKIILIGGGGHCKSVIDVIETEGKYDIYGIVDVKEKIGQSIFGYKVIASDEDIEKVTKEVNYFFISLGQIKSSQLRENFYSKLKNLPVQLPVIVSPYSTVSKHSSIGEGSIIMHKALVNAGAKIGYNCIINSNSIIEHDTQIGNHCHISTSAVINGDCKIEDRTFIGSNVTILNGVNIMENNIIGAGAVVLQDTEKNGVYVGNP
ncbi:MAG TPA: acetyltransferase, partial [Cytophagales bacterium]|nr:acetyltransferase [Cytophagales bacterium]